VRAPPAATSSRRVLTWVLPVGLLVAVAAGCASNPDAVNETASDFYAALADRRGADACALLAPETLREVEQAAGTACEDAILQEEIAPPGEQVQVSRFGNQAQVRFDVDTVFLAEFPEGWRVVAAGCTKRESRPYDCQVKGG
jgi:hypothetical protein